MASRRTSPMTDLALVAVFAGLIAAFALAPAIPVGPLGVPITLQTLAIAMTGMILGPWRGFAATSLYLLVALAGLPVFSGGAGGVGVLARPSAGYILAFPLAVLLIGLLARWFIARQGRARWGWLFLAGLSGSIVFIHPMGIVGMSLNGGLPLDKAFFADMLYWPGDLIKNAVAAAVAVAVHRAFPGLLVEPAVQRAPQEEADSV